MDPIQLPVELQPEIYLLICRFLDNGPCREVSNEIRRQLDRHELLPRRVDWLGQQHATTWRTFEQRHLHISAEFLPRVLSRVSSLLNKQIPASGFTGASLLGAGTQSLLRTTSGKKLKGYALTLITELIRIIRVDIVHQNQTLFLNATSHHSPRQPCHARIHLYPPNIGK